MSSPILETLPRAPQEANTDAEGAPGTSSKNWLRSPRVDNLMQSHTTEYILIDWHIETERQR